VDGDVRTLTGQFERNALADSHARAGDKSHASSKRPHERPPSRIVCDAENLGAASREFLGLPHEAGPRLDSGSLRTRCCVDACPYDETETRIHTLQMESTLISPP
jgi:hypothetical protein